jgi:hypothetical protein
MSKVIDLSGKIFSRLKVIQRADNDAHGNAQWLCGCECGNKAAITGTRLTRQIIKSCGCLRLHDMGASRPMILCRRGKYEV